MSGALNASVGSPICAIRIVLPLIIPASSHDTCRADLLRSERTFEGARGRAAAQAVVRAPLPPPLTPESLTETHRWREVDSNCRSLPGLGPLRAGRAAANQY